MNPIRFLQVIPRTTILHLLHHITRGLNLLDQYTPCHNNHKQHTRSTKSINSNLAFRSIKPQQQQAFCNPSTQHSAVTVPTSRQQKRMPNKTVVSTNVGCTRIQPFTNTCQIRDSIAMQQQQHKKHQKISVAISSPLPSTCISTALVTKASTGQLPQRSHQVASAGSQPHQSASSSTMNGCILSMTFAKPRNAVIAPCFSNTMAILPN